MPALPFPDTVERYQALVDGLLQRHYGINLGDTPMNDASEVAILMREGIRPFEVVNAHAQDCNLDRIDASPYSLGLRPLAEIEEIQVARSLGFLGEAGATKPKATSGMGL